MESIKDLKQALARARERGDERSVANAAYKLGELYRERGKTDPARALLQESLALCETHGNLHGKALVALSLCKIFLREGAPDLADPLSMDAHAILRDAGKPGEILDACKVRGDVCWTRKDPAAALPYFREALEICERHQDNLGRAAFLDRIATQHRLLGQETEARQHFQAAGRLWETLGIPDRQAVTLTNLGDIHARQGEIPEAIRLHEQALTLFRGLRNTRAARALEKELGRLRGLLTETSDDAP